MSYSLVDSFKKIGGKPKYKFIAVLKVKNPYKDSVISGLTFFIFFKICFLWRWGEGIFSILPILDFTYLKIYSTGATASSCTYRIMQ